MEKEELNQTQENENKETRIQDIKDEKEGKPKTRGRDERRTKKKTYRKTQKEVPKVVQTVGAFIRKWGLELILACIIVAMGISAFDSVFEKSPSMGYVELIDTAKEGKVDYITVERTTGKVYIYLKDGSEYTTFNMGYENFYKDLSEYGVHDIRTKTSTGGEAVNGFLTSILLFLLLYFIMKFLLRSVNTVDKIAEHEDLAVVNAVKFDDIAGMTEEKEELISSIKSLTDAENLKAKGMRPIKGVLLEGQPGVGKTLLAKAIAGEAGVNFLSYSGASFNEMFVGVGTIRVRAMFKEAMKQRPCVVFIDEIDSIGARRSDRDDSATRESNNTLTAILERMDGVSSADGILFIGATNRVAALDEALIRPGRFDKVIHISAPKTKEDREAIVGVHTRNKVLAPEATIEKIAKLCYGLTGAEIEGVMNDAVMESFREDMDGIVHLNHVDRAVMKVHVGGVTKGKHSLEDLERVAVHEVGHALVNQYLNRKVIKVSVQPFSSGVGGVTVVDNDTNGSHNLRTREDLLGDLKVLYGGMVAEEIILGGISTGNTSDLERATQILHNMVSTWGMSDETILSMQYFNKLTYDGVPTQRERNLMEDIGRQAREEVKTLFNIPENREAIETLAKELAYKEVIYDLPEIPLKLPIAEKVPSH